MQRLLFVLTLLFTLSSNSSLLAQWESLGENIIQQDHRVWSIKVAPDESAWAIATLDNFPPIGELPKIYRTADEGASWTSSEIPAAISTYGWDVSPIDSNKAFIALDTAGLYRTLNGGQDWTKVDSFIYRPFYVHFFNAQEGWILAADESGFLVMCVTEDGGDSWLYILYGSDIPVGTSLPPIDSTESVLPFTFSVNSAYAYDSESIILGTTKGTYWISNDKGKNWERRSSPLAGLGLNVSNVAMKDETTFMLAGDTEQGTFNGTRTVNYTTTDGGNTWIQGASGVTAAASHYLPNSDSIFIMVGHNNFGWGERGTAISYNYGRDWEILDDTRLIAVDFINENTGYGVCCNNFWPTANGQIYKWDFNLPTSTHELINPDFVTIMPNPVSTELTILMDGVFPSGELTIEVISMNGQIHSTKKVRNSAQIKVLTNDLPRGFYSLRISGDRKSVVKKFIKR